MKRDNKKALVPRPRTEIAGDDHGKSPVIKRMTRDVLAQAKARGVGQARFRIGDYVLREPDYRQIHIWAEALDMAPEQVLEQLAASRLEPEGKERWEPVFFIVEHGAIVSLMWEFDRLPIVPETWQKGLLIETLGFAGCWWEGAYVSDSMFPKTQALWHFRPKLQSWTSRSCLS